jgi:hypothetical protein
LFFDVCHDLQFDRVGLASNAREALISLIVLDG